MTQLQAPTSHLRRQAYHLQDLATRHMGAAQGVVQRAKLGGNYQFRGAAMWVQYIAASTRAAQAGQITSKQTQRPNKIRAEYI